MPFVPNEVPFVKLAASDDVYSIAPHPDATLVAACAGPHLYLLSCPDLKKVAKEQGKESRVCYSPDGSTLVRTEGPGLWIYDPRTGKRLRELANIGTSCGGLAFSPDGTRLVVSTFKRACVIDLATSAQVEEFTGDQLWEHVAWSPDGRHVALRARTSTSVYEVAGGTCIATIPCADRSTVAFLGNGALATAFEPTTVGIFGPDDWETPARRIQLSFRAFAIASCPTLLAIGDGLSIRMFDAAMNEVEPVQVGGDAYSLALSPDGTRLFAGCSGKLHVFAGAPSAKPAKVVAPIVETKVCGERLAPAVDPSSAPYLSALGKPLPKGADVEPLATLEAWPGVDDAGVGDFLVLIQTLDEDLSDAARAAGVTLPEGTYDGVFGQAAKRVPYDEGADWSTPASAAPLFVALLASIAEKYRALGLPMPTVIETAWAWCLEGHWPAGFAIEPAKGARRLLVL